MASIYENVLNIMTETSASIISNNQNSIMKTLALMTMALDIPTVIFSAYGMNFKNNWLPLNGSAPRLLGNRCNFHGLECHSRYLFHPQTLVLKSYLDWSHPTMDLQELTKKNQEFVTIATHQFKPLKSHT